MTISDQKGGDDENPLTEKLIATPVAVPVSEGGESYISVVAPATLPAGYTFEAVANGQSFTVTVPAGGVTEGQTFRVPSLALNVNTGAANSGVKIPEGGWRDGLCDCCANGICHPALWNACCCPMVLAGQVMQRLRLTWYGDQGNAQTKSTFKILLWVTIIYIIVTVILQSIYSQDVAQDQQTGNTFLPTTSQYYPLYVADSILEIIYAVFLIIIVLKTRGHIRRKYHIPEKKCRGCEDCCCAFWCTCCTVAQIARHTADYETYSGKCCSETGLTPTAPPIVDV